MDELTIKTHRGRLRLERHNAGAGTVLVCLHGLGSASSTFRALAMRFPERELLAPDLLGFGGSDRPKDFDYSMAGQAAVVAEGLGALGVETCDVLGHSMGGTIALALAALFPRLVRRLVVAEPNLRARGGNISRRALARSEQDYVQQGLWEVFRDFLPTPNAKQSHVHYWQTLATADPIAMHRASLRLIQLDEFDALSLLQRAEGLIAGEDSGDSSPEQARAVGARVEVVSGAGHDMFIENCEGSAQALRLLLD